MSRTVGGQTLWGSARWGVDTWASTTPQSTLMTRLLQDPATTTGVPLKSGSNLRLVIEMLSPASASAATWGHAHWGVDHWPDTVGAWVDITNRVRGLSWTQGVTQPGARCEVGTGTATLNNLDGQVSPWASTGPFTLSGQSFVRSGLILRWGVINTTTAIYSPFFTGKVESTPESVSENVDSWVDLNVVELTADLATVPPPENVASGRALSAVIGTVINDASWPYGLSYTAPDEDVDVCSALLADNSANERLQLLTGGMHWDFCADGRGQILVFQRHLSSHAMVATFANKPTGAQLPMADAQPYSDISRVLNRVTGSVVGGVEITRNDSGSESRFGVITNGYGFPEDGLVLVDEDAVTALANRVLSLRAWDDHGIGSVNLDADMSTSLLSAMTDLACNARDGRPYGVVFTHPSGNVLTQTAVIEGQSHGITMMGTQVKWTATLQVGHNGPVSES